VIEIVVVVDATDPYYPIMKADALDQAAGWQSGARQFLSNQDGIPRRDATSIVAPIRADANIRSRNYLTDADRRLAQIENAAQSQQGNRGQGVITTPPSPADRLRQMDPLANRIAEGVVQGTPEFLLSYGAYRLIRLIRVLRRVEVAQGGVRHVLQFGQTDNQVYHAFRHTDALGLDRAAIQTAIAEHFPSVSSRLTVGRPLNAIIEVAGQRVQYTAYRLPNGVINIGRIHGVQ